ncbi:MAG: peptidoglycan DD-metalloendopeptidase family protein [Candidatus Pacebacteria bacterium]|nr:peptidoglycan DD-metalloendopeptidase family protein [Candidatus Paceibacterota bacterium]
MGFRILAAFIVLAVASTGVVVHAQSSDDIQAEIDRNAGQVQKLKEEIQKLQTELNATNAQKQTLQTAVKSIDLNIQKLTKNISLTEAQIKAKDAEIHSISGNISNANGSIGNAREQIAGSLRELSFIDKRPLVLSMLAGASLSSIFDETDSLESLRSNLQLHIEDLSSLKVDLEVDKTDAEGKRREMASLNQRLASEKSSLAVARAEQNKLLDETKNKESSYQAQIAQKQAEQAAFERALFDLASKLQGDSSQAPSPQRGILRWPLDNVFVTQQFGKTVDASRLYQSGTHDGVDFRASVGTPIKAALSGTVYEINHGAVQYCQYGKWVLVKHNNGLTTLYAHLSNINVTKGQEVSTGEVLGYAGNTGYATGPHLHFTVYASEALSLKQYACKSGSSVTIPIAPVNAYLNPLSYLP